MYIINVSTVAPLGNEKNILLNISVTRRVYKTLVLSVRGEER